MAEKKMMVRRIPIGVKNEEKKLSKKLIPKGGK